MGFFHISHQQEHDQRGQSTKEIRMAENEEQVPQTETEQTEGGENTDENGVEPEFIRDPILDQEEMKKMFVGGIASDSTEEELKTFFEELSGGVVTDIVIIKKENQKHFGFVTFESSELVDEVLLKREQLKFKEKQLEVNRAVPKNNTSAGAHDKTKKLFIANLPKKDCCAEDLETYFKARHPKKYGFIEKIQLIKKKDEQGNQTAENKGFGFIEVSSEDLADKMAIQHQNFEFQGRKIELKKSVPTNSEGGGGRKGGRGGRGGGYNQFSNNQQYGYGGYGGYNQFGGPWDNYQGYDYGYYGGYPPYGGGHQGGRGGGRGRGAGNRY